MTLPWERSWGRRRGNIEGRCSRCPSTVIGALPPLLFGRCNRASPRTAGALLPRRWPNCSPVSAAAASPSRWGPRSCAPRRPSPHPPSGPAGSYPTAPILCSSTPPHPVFPGPRRPRSFPPFERQPRSPFLTSCDFPTPRFNLSEIPGSGSLSGKYPVKMKNRIESFQGQLPRLVNVFVGVSSLTHTWTVNGRRWI